MTTTFLVLSLDIGTEELRAWMIFDIAAMLQVSREPDPIGANLKQVSLPARGGGRNISFIFLPLLRSMSLIFGEYPYSFKLANTLFDLLALQAIDPSLISWTYEASYMLINENKNRLVNIKFIVEKTQYDSIVVTKISLQIRWIISESINSFELKVLKEQQNQYIGLRNWRNWSLIDIYDQHEYKDI